MNKSITRITLYISSVTLAILLLSPNVHVIICMLSSMAIGFFIFRKININIINGFSLDKSRVVLSVVLSIILCILGSYAFYYSCVSSEKMNVLLTKLGFENIALLPVFLSVISGVVAFPASLLLTFKILNVSKRENKCGFYCNRKQVIISVVVIAILQQTQLQYSSMDIVSDMFHIKGYMFVICVILLFGFNVIVWSFIGNFGMTLMITSIIVFLWSIINYYVILFHGSPLFFSEFANFWTAMRVMTGYSIRPSHTVVLLYFMFFIQLLYAVRLLYRTKNVDKGLLYPKVRLLWGIGALISIFLVVLCFNISIIKPKRVMTWSWYEGVEKYGYVTCIYEDIIRRINPVIEPDEYSTSEVNSIRLNETESMKDHPDVILILNESFYDLNQCIDIDVDSDYLSAFYSIPNAKYGKAYVPDIGGGTNDSEMELLTSNSMFLLPVGAPFNYLDFTKNNNSIANSFLKEGYNTSVLHISKTNYSRNLVYPRLGFKNVVLGENMFSFEKYGERPWTDAGNYKDMVKLYNTMGDMPRFIYLLTYQNHGGYELNDYSWDTVHAQEDFGELNSIIDEYLTSVSLSANAFAELIDLYKSSDRPVIICMVGDHCPTFVQQISARYNKKESDYEFDARAVPYVVWSNCDIRWPENASMVSLVDLGPMIKQAAGLQLSTYDNAILELHSKVPVRISNGMYLNVDGEQKKYDPEEKNIENEMIRRYLFMEYNLLNGGTDYRSELFEIDN